ncbi:MAG: glycerol-3-phosphate dehydrogenase/oxidase [Actinomycetota bacterium]|nr:glycerol-3-phosphate dehydrogenase/oxidase [Actinomycetota bacterium]
MPALTSFDRTEAWRRLAERHFDVVIIGGGITGAGVALDAAARGLRTALVEADDLAAGTSSASSKLVHGGLRYLSSHDYRLVYEALAERQRLLRNAPHLVHPLPFLIPLFGRDGTVAKGVAQAYSSALWLYDLTGGLRIGHRHRRIGAAEALAHVPLLRTDRLVASFVYWDAQTDDARLTLALARTAVLAYGATVATRARVTGFLRAGATSGVAGVRLADGTEVRGEVVVNATGVWSAEVANLPGGSSPGTTLRPAKGAHVTVRADRLPCDTAAVLSVPGDHRSVFIVPWDAAGLGRAGSFAAGGSGWAGPEWAGSDRFTYIGTTDTAYDGPLDDAGITPADVDYLLGTVNRWTTANLTPADVTGSWAGLRPLVAGEVRARTADLSRRHRVTTSPEGVVTVTGGKLTTYRLMAADTVDAVVARLGRRLLGYSPTRRLPLWGADGWADLLEAGAADELGLSEPTLAHLAGRYGGEARTIAALVSADKGLGEPLVAGLPYLKAEAIFAARYEMALTVVDVLARRTRALLLDRDATTAAAPEVAALVGAELGWSRERQAAEVGMLRSAADAGRVPLTGSAAAASSSPLPPPLQPPEVAP